MHLTGTRLTEHAHEGALGITAHDGVIDHHEALAFDDIFERIQFQTDTQLTDRLAGLDECPAYVGVLDKPFGKGNS